MLNVLKDPVLKIVVNTAQKLPAPKNLTTMWNFGSLLAICLMTQILSGLILVAAYAPGMEDSFKLVFINMENTANSWLFRYIHANGASLFFICLFAHTGRGIYYRSYKNEHTWSVGVTMLLMTMAAAFMGYVLPANQMSYWGASVITNLFTEIPYIGGDVVKLIWGGPSVSAPTVNRMLMVHFLVPFVILALTILHITYLHITGSSNPLSMSKAAKKLLFDPFFSVKDASGILLVLMLFFALCQLTPLLLGDDENFVEASSSVTPHHIQPEWYFLFAYAILRSIPNKLGGVIALAASVLILYTLPKTTTPQFKNSLPNKSYMFMFGLLVLVVVLLSWIGMRPVEDPYIFTGQILTVLYFSYFMLTPLLGNKSTKS